MCFFRKCNLPATSTGVPIFLLFDALSALRIGSRRSKGYIGKQKSRPEVIKEAAGVTIVTAKPFPSQNGKLCTENPDCYVLNANCHLVQPRSRRPQDPRQRKHARLMEDNDRNGNIKRDVSYFFVKGVNRIEKFLPKNTYSPPKVATAWGLAVVDHPEIWSLVGV